jgi:hypothetical protein
MSWRLNNILLKGKKFKPGHLPRKKEREKKIRPTEKNIYSFVLVVYCNRYDFGHTLLCYLSSLAKIMLAAAMV